MLELARLVLAGETHGGLDIGFHLKHVAAIVDIAGKAWDDPRFQRRMWKRGLQVDFAHQKQDVVDGATFVTSEIGNSGFTGALEYAWPESRIPRFSLVPADVSFPVAKVTPEKLLEVFLFAREIVRGLDGDKIKAIAEPVAGGSEMLDYLWSPKIGQENYVQVGFAIFRSGGVTIAPIVHVPPWTLTINTQRNVPQRENKILEYVNRQATASYKKGVVVRDR